MKHLLIVTSLGATLLASLNASPVRAQEAAIGVSVSAPLTPVTLGAAAVVMIIANEAFARHPFGPDGEIMKILAVPVKIVDGNVKAAAGGKGRDRESAARGKRHQRSRHRKVRDLRRPELRLPQALRLVPCHWRWPRTMQGHAPETPERTTPMKKLLSALVVTTALAGLSQSPAFATSGALDFLDPCIKARSNFAEQRQAYFAKLNITEGSIDTLSATPAFKTAWLAEVRKQARPLFDEKLAPSLRQMGATDMEKAFSVWFDMEIAAVKPEDLDNRINADFHRLAKEEMNEGAG